MDLGELFRKFDNDEFSGDEIGDVLEDYFEGESYGF